LHRTAGDTERRYHLRYYKTCMCVHDTDSRGFCVKNGPHCAFAHGNQDLRPPVYDIKEIQALDCTDGDNASCNGPNVLDKERNLMNEDPKWQDTNYVLSSYKTEACKRPPRLCRQGYACPQYHNSRDKRRSPRKFKYRSTPCPNVKHGDEWGEPGNCENGDLCGYCHTRTEQQFHPEIYKSTRCNDVQQAGYCPRGVFCAFAHVDQEMSIARELAAPLDGGTNLADILSNVLPKRDQKSSESSNGSGEVSECASTSSLGSNSSSKAPGANRHSFTHQPQHEAIQQEIIRKQLKAIDSDPMLDVIEKSQKKQALLVALNMNMGANHTTLLPLSPHYHSPFDSVMGNALEDLHLDEPLGLVESIHRDFETDSPTISNSISAGLANSGILGGSAPVNIPGSGHNSLSNFSPSASSPLHHLHSGFLSASRFSHQDTLDSGGVFMSKLGSHCTSGFDHYNMSPSSHSPLINNFPVSPRIGSGSYDVANRNKLLSWEERVSQARVVWQRECEEAQRKASIAEQQRDEAISQAKALQQEVDLLQGSPYLHGLRRISELRNLSLATLKSLQSQLRGDLEEIEKVLYLQTATKCMVCEERNRSVTLGPCNHFVLCSTCAPQQKDCPYCQTPIIAHSNHNSLQAPQT